MGVISADVDDHARRVTASRVRIDQVQPTEGVPGFAKKFAGETTRAVQTEEWASPAGGTITIETPGKPTSINGTLSLAETGGVTTETMDAEVKVKVPLIGGKLESLMADLVPQGMDKEQAAGVAWLAGEQREEVSEDLRYDGATLEQVHAMLADPAFREKVCDYQGVLRHTVQIDRERQGHDGGHRPGPGRAGHPGFAKKFVGDEINIVQTEDWTSPTEGQHPRRHPRQARRDERHRPAHRGPRRHHRDRRTSTVKVNIPLVGGKIEGLIADLLSKALRAEHQVGVDWLAGQ